MRVTGKSWAEDTSGSPRTKGIPQTLSLKKGTMHDCLDFTYAEKKNPNAESAILFGQRPKTTKKTKFKNKQLGQRKENLEC